MTRRPGRDRAILRPFVSVRPSVRTVRGAPPALLLSSQERPGLSLPAPGADNADTARRRVKTMASRAAVKGNSPGRGTGCEIVQG